MTDASGSAQAPSRWWMLAAVECGHFVVYIDAFIVTQAAAKATDK